MAGCTETGHRAYTHGLTDRMMAETEAINSNIAANLAMEHGAGMSTSSADGVRTAGGSTGVTGLSDAELQALLLKAAARHREAQAILAEEVAAASPDGRAAASAQAASRLQRAQLLDAASHSQQQNDRDFIAACIAQGLDAAQQAAAGMSDLAGKANTPASSRPSRLPSSRRRWCLVAAVASLLLAVVAVGVGAGVGVQVARKAGVQEPPTNASNATAANTTSANSMAVNNTAGNTTGRPGDIPGGGVLDPTRSANASVMRDPALAGSMANAPVVMPHAAVPGLPGAQPADTASVPGGALPASRFNKTAAAKYNATQRVAGAPSLPPTSPSPLPVASRVQQAASPQQPAAWQAQQPASPSPAAWQVQAASPSPAVSPVQHSPMLLAPGVPRRLLMRARGGVSGQQGRGKHAL